MDLKTIIKKCKKGRVSAQKELYELYAPTLYYICLRYAKNPEIAQDLLHDGFMIIFDKISSFKGEGSFEGWMKRIMINHSLAYLRQLSKERDLFTDSHDSIDTLEEQDVDDAPVISLDKVLRLLNRLPDGCRTVFNLYYIEGYSHKEIAGELMISEGTSKSQLNRAKQLLREEVNKEKGSYVG